MEIHSKAAGSPEPEIIDKDQKPTKDKSQTINSVSEIVDDADESDKGSVGSEDSDSSKMEPFESYQKKIEQLCAELNLQDYAIEVIQHGYGYQNCVYSLSSASDPAKDYVLRVLQCSQESDGLCVEIMDELAVLGYLQGKVPVPKVKYYDLSEQNPLGQPFTIQTRLPGLALSKVYEGLSQPDKFAIIDQVVDIMVQLEAIRFPTAGHLKSKGTVIPSSKDGNVVAGELVTELFDSRYPNDEHETDEARLRERGGPNLESHMRSLIEGWIERQREEDLADLDREGKDKAAWDDDMSCEIPTYKRLLSMLRDLDDQSAFKQQPFPIVLYHWDLEPRNILVEKSHGVWKITGIIDWDGAEAVPRPLARRPPVWMWDFGEEPESGFYNSDQYPDPELSVESQHLKDYFDSKVEKALPGYLEDAYGPGRWLRRMFPYCKLGLSDSNDMRYCQELLEQWEARPPINLFQKTGRRSED